MASSTVAAAADRIAEHAAQHGLAAVRVVLHGGEPLLLGPAGTVIVFNAHLWHGGTRNTTTVPRRGMTLSFCRRNEPQQRILRRPAAECMHAAQRQRGQCDASIS